MPDDRTAGWLQSARINQENAARVLADVGTGHPCIAAVVNVDSPRLVFAVEAVLKLAAGAKVTGTTVCDCEDCITARRNGFTGVHRPQPYRWDLDPAKVREAITAALALAPSPPETGIPTSSRGG